MSNTIKTWWIDEHQTTVHEVGNYFYGGKTGREIKPHIEVIDVAFIKKISKWIPHIPKSYEQQMGGAMNGLCGDNCPKCFIENMGIYENG